MRPGEERQRDGAAKLERKRGAGDPPAVEAVGGPAGDERQQEQGHELDDADDPEAERGFLEAHRLARDVVDLPADHDDHRHLSNGRGQSGEPEVAECRDSERFGKQAHSARLAGGCGTGNRVPGPGLG